MCVQRSVWDLEFCVSRGRFRILSFVCPEVGLGYSLFSGCARFRIVAAAAAPLVFFTYGYDRGPDDVRATIPTITTATTMAAATW